MGTPERVVLLTEDATDLPPPEVPQHSRESVASGAPTSMLRRHNLVATALAAAVLVAGACESTVGEGGIDGPWTAERSQLADTLVVRTLSGSVWRDTATLEPEVAIGRLDGEDAYLFGGVGGLAVASDGRIVVTDDQANEVRVYSPDGRHLQTFGRNGDGPGEFRRADYVRIAGDGRIIVRDRGAGRFAVFSPEGIYLNGWTWASGFSTTAPFYLDQADHLVNPSVRNGLVSYDLDGAVLDTIPIPTKGFAPTQVVVTTERGRASYGVPFTQREEWSIGPDGSYLFGVGDRYALERWSPDGTVLRLERAADATVVAEGEAAQAREGLVRSIRRFNDANWTWDGPDVPTTKPYFGFLQPGIDGTIWVFREGPASETSNPSWDPDQPLTGFPTRWVSRVTADVFDAEGRYLGPVRLPDNIRWTNPSPVLSGDRVWAVGTHELGYPQVMVFRVATP